MRGIIHQPILQTTDNCILAAAPAFPQHSTLSTQHFRLSTNKIPPLGTY